MSILIKGMEMPKEGLNQERISITIWADGSVTNDGDYFRNEDGSYRKEYWNYEQFSAIELPPHGRLIDADALIEAVPPTNVDIFENCRRCELLDQEQVIDLINDAPTIIESEE